MKKFALTAIAAACLLAREPGLRPRPNSNSYPSHVSDESVSLGAAVLPESQVKRSFATDLNKGYMVVEVALYPGADGRIDVKRDDFELVSGNMAGLRPVSAQAIVATLTRPVDQRRNRNNDVAVYPTADVGYESGRVYDPSTGRTTNGGWHTGAGVGVGMGNPGPNYPPPASTPGDRHTMATELEDKSLPEGAYLAPVSGYLYFAMPAGKKRPSTYELHYYGPKGDLKTILGVPRD